MIDAMIDLETWGVAPGCAIRSVGACLFDPGGAAIDDEFYLNVSDESSDEMGFTRDPRTVQWWAQQSEEARAILLNEPRPIRYVLSELASWFRRSRAQCIWSHGASFDVPIVEEAMRRCRIEPPWKFYDVRDTRTLFDVAGLDLRDMRREGVCHRALDDAVFQARCVQEAMRRLRAREALF